MKIDHRPTKSVVFLFMIHLKLGETNNIYATAVDYGDNSYGIYYFKFQNRTTFDVVEMWLTNESTSNRYQKFEIVVNDYFEGYAEGTWDYVIIGADQVDVVPTYDVLESGYMYLHRATEYQPTKYNEQSNTFKAYNG